MIPFNKLYFTGNEAKYIADAMSRGKTAGDGHYTKLCQDFFCETYGFKKTFLTTSCTDALELCALLIDLRPGDEVIMPSYTFVSMSNAFLLRGAKLVFADSNELNPNIDAGKIEALITPATKAIVVVHYAGIACDMDQLKAIADKHHIFLIEDAAQGFDSYYDGKPLGSIGHLGAMSFHETKNITCGEGGLLIINDERFIKRAEIIREKGTNRSAFFRGEVDKYSWVDIGSSFLPSEVLAAYLYAQLEQKDNIQQKRKATWEMYYEQLRPLEEKGIARLPHLPEYATNNAHIFYLVCKDLETRTALINHMKANQVQTPFHYVALHDSPYYIDKHDGRPLPWVTVYQDHLVRLPLFCGIIEEEISRVTGLILEFFQKPK
ncbi:MAG: dTDP-4-amino-4,6-dideoxygalactose transaminase [Bacteroidetes bacterium]|nr:dTDP-4-amino-4,6-dideoxygalactose transaminase [Bacteroidota bacterium]